MLAARMDTITPANALISVPANVRPSAFRPLQRSNNAPSVRPQPRHLRTYRRILRGVTCAALMPIGPSDVGDAGAGFRARRLVNSCVVQDV
jgi:hypothetical protein